MRNFKNNFKKNRFRNNSDRIFKRNGNNKPFQSSYNELIDNKRKKINKNFNPIKLIEKYTELAKEALSNGDKILSENYLQHADHFIRISDKQNSSKSNSEIISSQSNLTKAKEETENQEIDTN
tara:strand:+ start:3188 stop:3556 length:369 start_codon:yes stop_codon:yes gene_type:complete